MLDPFNGMSDIPPISIAISLAAKPEHLLPDLGVPDGCRPRARGNLLGSREGRTMRALRGSSWSSLGIDPFRIRS